MRQQGRIQSVTTKLQGLQVCQLSTAPEQSQLAKAYEQRKGKWNKYYKEEQISNIPKLSHFKMYGTGIYLFFQFVKHTTLLFAILTVVSVVPIVVNVVLGSNFKNSVNSLNIIIAKTSLGSHRYSLLQHTQQSYQLSIACKIINVTFDVLGCAIFLVFCFYWQIKSKKLAKKVQLDTKLQSAYTVEVVQFAPNTTEQDVREFMSKFGNVIEVAPATQQSQSLDLCNKIVHVQQQITQVETSDKKQQRKKQQLQQLHEQLNELYQKLKTQLLESHRIQRFYVQYESQQQRNKVINKFAKYQKFKYILCQCYLKVPQEYTLNNESVRVIACETEPTAIVWQNSDVTWKKRLLFTCLQIVITFLIINCSFLLVSFIKVLVPSTQSNIQASGYTYTDILALNAQDSNSKVVQAWCIQHYKLTQYEDTCSAHWNMFTVEAVLGILIAIMVMMLRKVTQKIIDVFAQFQKYPTHSQKSIADMTKLYTLQFLSSNIMTFLAQANLFGLSVIFILQKIIPLPSSSSSSSSSQFNDLSSNWYKDVGYQLWMNICVLCFLPHLFMPLVSLARQKYGEYRASRQREYKKAQEKLSLQQFSIQTQYVNILFIVSTGFVFGGGIQAMMLVVMLCLLARYFYLRYMFIRFCAVPPIYNQSLNNRSITILKVVLVLRCMMSLYMYAADDVFATDTQNGIIKWVQQLGVPVLDGYHAVLAKLLITWYYSIFVGVFLLVLLLQQGVVRIARQCQIRMRSRKVMPENVIPVQEISHVDVPQTMNQHRIRPDNQDAHYNNLPHQNSQHTKSSSQSTPNKTNTSPTHTYKQLHQVSEIGSQLQIYSAYSANQEDDVKSQRITIKSYKFQNNPNYAQAHQIMKAALSRPTKLTNNNNLQVQQIVSQQFTAAAKEVMKDLKTKVKKQVKKQIKGKMSEIF